MLTELEAHPDWGMAHAALRASKDGEEYFRAFEGTHHHLLVANHVDLNVLVVRRELVEAVGGFDETLRRGVDYDLMLKLGPDQRPPPGALHRRRLRRRRGRRRRAADQHPGVRRPGCRSSPRATWSTGRPRSPPSGRRDGPAWCCRALGTVRPTARWIRTVADALGATLPATSSWSWSACGSPAGSTSCCRCSPPPRRARRLVTIQADRGTATTANVGFAATTGERVVLVLGQVEPDAAAAVALAGTLADARAGGRAAAGARPDRVGAGAGAVFDPDTARPETFLHDHAVDDADGCAGLRAAGRGRPGARGPRRPPGRARRPRSPVRPPRGHRPVAAGAPRRARRHRAPPRRPVRVEGRPGPGRRRRSWPLAGPRRAGTPAYRLARRRRGRPPASRSADYRYDVLPGQPVGPADAPGAAPRAPCCGPTRDHRVRSRAALDDRPGLTGRTEAGLAWGDTHFGEALAAGPAPARSARRGRRPRDPAPRQTRSLDDVILVLRGLDRVAAPARNASTSSGSSATPTWSRPTRSAGFDRVYAASHSWAEQVTATWGIDVRPLLQATDPTALQPATARSSTPEPTCCSSATRAASTAPRCAAKAAGIDVTVHGAGLEQQCSAPTTVGLRLVDNRELGALYAAAGLVLNDHWEDMRLTGFVSNRLMDAAASGARVASDEIPGPRPDRDVRRPGADLDRRARHARGSSASRDSLFPSGDDRVRAAERVAAEHSFDARAEVILDDVLDLLARRGVHDG